MKYKAVILSSKRDCVIYPAHLAQIGIHPFLSATANASNDTPKPKQANSNTQSWLYDIRSILQIHQQGHL